MSACPACGGVVRRSHRSLWERLFYRAAFRCRSCDQRTLLRRRVPLPSRYANCPRCTSRSLEIRKKRDYIDELNGNPLRLIQRFFGARLYHCLGCRLQYYDLRRLQPVRRTAASDGYR